MAFNGQTLPTTQRAVLLAFRDRLIEAVPDLDAFNCFVTDQPLPDNLPDVAPLRMVTVCTGPGIGDEPTFAGAGFHDLVERVRILVTLYQVSKGDLQGHSENRLLSETDGMLAVFKLHVLKALQNHDGRQWMPTDADGNGLLRDHPMPITASPPQLVAIGETEQEYTAMAIDFDATFSWDIS